MIRSYVMLELCTFVSSSTSSIKNIFGPPHLWSGPHLLSHIKQRHLSLFYFICVGVSLCNGTGLPSAFGRVGVELLP